MSEERGTQKIGGDTGDQRRLEVERGLLPGNPAAFGRASRALLHVCPKFVAQCVLETRWGLLGKKEDMGLLCFKTCSLIQYFLQEMMLSSPLLECGLELVTCF